MRWAAPPDRREITLLLFSLIIYGLSYNLETSLHLLGLDAVATQSAIFNRLGLGGSSVIGNDGRRPPGWRDQLENVIFGDWGWDPGHVGGDGAERSQARVDKYGAVWIGREKTGDVAGDVFGETTADDVLDWWEYPPTATVLRHTPGYTVADNVIIFNGSIYLVTDDPLSVPPISSVVSSTSLYDQNEWYVINREEAKEIMPNHGGKIGGVTWISTDPTGDNSTLLALWRAYSSLDPSIDNLGRTILPPPRRIFFPNIKTFSDPFPPTREDPRRRVRAASGFHPYLPKVAFPTLGIMYQSDWDDFSLREAPFVLERAVIADRAAAAAVAEAGKPVFAECLNLEGSEYWWEPVRRTLATYFDVYEDAKRVKNKKPVITYLHRQADGAGSRIRDSDHEALVTALKRLEKDNGYEIHVLGSLDTQTTWNVRMKTVARSTILLGIHGDNLLDSVFLKPSPQTTLMEFFPTGMFSQVNQLPAKALGTKYIAWWNDRKFDKESDLPVFFQPTDQEVHIDVTSVIQTIKEILSSL